MAISKRLNITAMENKNKMNNSNSYKVLFFEDTIGLGILSEKTSRLSIDLSRQ